MYLTQRFQVVFMLFDVKLPWYRAGNKNLYQENKCAKIK